jgi:hypothetical protein
MMVFIDSLDCRRADAKTPFEAVALAAFAFSTAAAPSLEALSSMLGRRWRLVRVLYVLRSSNSLDTRVAGSYNRRPLSPGTSAGHKRPSILFHASAALI